MPSSAYHHWITVRATALDEIEQAHTAVGGTGRGRRYATQQINRAYVMLLASQFQGYCRDLHSECVDHILRSISLPATLQDLVYAEFTRGRRLDRGNAQPSSLGADFERLGIVLWDELIRYHASLADCKNQLDVLNEWRNAIAHQNFTSPKLGATMNLQLSHVRKWRRTCKRLSDVMDEVLRRHLQTLTGTMPW